MFTSKRITLRGIEEEDLPLFSQFDNDLVTELATGGDPPLPHPKAHRVHGFSKSVNQQTSDSASFAIETEGQLIGHCALFHFDNVARTAEIGITIGLEEFRGKGYGRETVEILLMWAFRYRNLHRVWLTTNASNLRASGCYHACGFVEEGRQRQHVWFDGRYDDLVLMGILQEEWESKQ